MSEPWIPAGKRVRLLGFWVSPGTNSLPNPAALVDVSWDEAERQRVADYLSRGQVVASFMGASRCRLCSCINGSHDLTDGAYLWPEGLSHYVLDHSVRLPAEFLEHIERRLDDLERLERDGSWWQLNAMRI